MSLSTISKTILTMDPEIPEALKLKQWYEDSGRTAPTTSAGEGLASAKSPGQGRSNAVVSLKEVQPEVRAASKFERSVSCQGEH